MKVRQVELSAGSTWKVVWVDAELRLREGFTVTGRDGMHWRVENVSDQVHEREDIHHDWRVGGLP